jgi:hypothetical protein
MIGIGGRGSATMTPFRASPLALNRIHQMRADLNKVLTEQPRRGSASRNLTTRAHFNSYDDAGEDRFALPKTGKMLMGNRDLGPHDESKEFTDNLGPLRRWLEAQAGCNWDKVYSEIKRAFPNRNKQNHHLLDTHLLGYIVRDPIVEKSSKGRRVYSIHPYAGKCELRPGEIYIDPATHVLMKYPKRPPLSHLRAST